MWISRVFFEELQRTREKTDAVDAVRREYESKLVSERARRLQAEERIKVLENSFEWLSSSHERLERWFAELMQAKAHVAIPVSTIAREGTVAAPIGEGTTMPDVPGNLEDLFRKNANALFEDMGDALAAREGIATTDYRDVASVIAGE